MFPKIPKSARTSRLSMAIGASMRARWQKPYAIADLTTPLWALADSSRIADLSVLGMVGEVDGFIYLGQQTPAFYAKQVSPASPRMA